MKTGTTRSACARAQAKAELSVRRRSRRNQTSAVRCKSQAVGSGRASGAVPVAVVVVLVVEVFVLVVIPIVVVLVPIVLVFFFLFFLFLGLFVVAGPAFGLRRQFQVELMPGVEVDFLDITVFVLNLDQLLVRVDRQHLEDLVLFEILVPFSLDRVVISGHANTSSDDEPVRSPGGGILGAFSKTA